MSQHLALTWIIFFLCFAPGLIKGYTCSTKNCPTSEPKYGYPDNRFEPYPFATPIPVALKTKYAYPICRPKVEIKIDEHALLLVNNTGEEVQFTPYIEGQRVATATGGIVDDFIYSFLEMSFTVDGVPEDTRTADTLNDVGTPLKFWVNFKKILYGDNYTSFRDGLYKFDCPGIVEGYVDNLQFTPIQKALSKVSTFKSTTIVKAKDVLPFVFQPFLSSEWYYSYPGAQYPQQQYFIYNTLDNYPSFGSYQSISYNQYNTFAYVYDKYNQSQYRSAALHELKPRPFVQVRNSSVCVKFVSHL